MHACTHTNIHTYVHMSNNTYTNIRIFNNTQNQVDMQIPLPTAGCMKPWVRDSHHHHHVVPPAWISLTLSRHFWRILT